MYYNRIETWNEVHISNLKICSVIIIQYNWLFLVRKILLFKYPFAQFLVMSNSEIYVRNTQPMGGRKNPGIYTYFCVVMETFI